MEIDVNLRDRIKSIVDKEAAFNIAIKELNYEKVRQALEKTPEILLPKHLNLAETISAKKDLSPDQLKNIDLIGKEINYVAEKNFANYYAYANNLKFDNPNVALRTELSLDPPCNKEPLIHYISQGADSTMMNQKNVDKKLQDINFIEIGGAKVLEKDKQDLITFAVITAIKKDDLGAFQHLDKEFNYMAQDLSLDKSRTQEIANYATANNAQKISEYIGNINTLDSKIQAKSESFDNTYKNSQKVNSILETKKLIAAIEERSMPKIEQAVLNGANVNYPKIHEKINSHDQEDKGKIVMSIYNSVQERNKKVPDDLKYKFDFKETLKLQEAAVRGNALQAYSAIKKGADPKGIIKDNYNHLSKDVKSVFESAVFKATTENAKGLTVKQDNSNSNNLKL